MNENEKVGELMAFLQANIRRTLNPRNRLFSFNARIVYRHESGVARFETKVLAPVDAQMAGRISLTENKECPVQDFHLGFWARYDEMRYDRARNVLVVNGESEKMGVYELTIEALAPCEA